MKSQKGITLTSLTVYIIGITIVLATVTVISTHFYSNTYSTVGDINPLTEYTKFTSFFADEVNHSKIRVLDCKDSYIIFDNGVQYTFLGENKAIYRNKVKVCKNVTNCFFEYKVQNGKEVVITRITMENEEKPREVTYTLKN